MYQVEQTGSADGTQANVVGATQFQQTQGSLGMLSGVTGQAFVSQAQNWHLLNKFESKRYLY